MAVLHHKCQPGLSPPPPRSRASALREGKKRNNNKNETKQNETPKKRNRKRVQWRCPVSRTGGAPGSPAAVHRAGVSVGLEPPSPGLHPAGPPCSEWCPPRRPSGPGGNGSPSRTPGRGPERSPPPSPTPGTSWKVTRRDRGTPSPTPGAPLGLTVNGASSGDHQVPSCGVQRGVAASVGAPALARAIPPWRARDIPAGAAPRSSPALWGLSVHWERGPRANGTGRGGTLWLWRAPLEAQEEKGLAGLPLLGGRPPPRRGAGSRGRRLAGTREPRPETGPRPSPSTCQAPA